MEHDPEKWVPVFPRDKREAFARRSCSKKKIERNDDSKKSHHALWPQAARTEFRNLPTSSLRRLPSPDSVCAADSTCDEADPVSLAHCWTSVMCALTCVVPSAACCTLRESSCVAAPCSSTAAAMVDEISDSRTIVPLISLMAVTESSV